MCERSWALAAVLVMAGCTPLDLADPDAGAGCGSGGPCADGFTCVDGQCRENGARDAGTDAAARSDAGGAVDAGADASLTDADVADGGGDGGLEDAGPTDAGPPDAGPTDAGPSPCVTASCPPLTACFEGACVASRVVFVTSRTFGANFGSLAAADAQCQSLGDAALPGRRWKAWLSDDSASAHSRLTHSTIPYRRVDGALVADDWVDLVDGSLHNPIDHDENGAVPVVVPPDSPEVWTGTTATGSTFSHCRSWTSSSVTDTGVVGSWQQQNSSWSRVYSQTCERTNVRLYCFEQ